MQMNTRSPGKSANIDMLTHAMKDTTTSGGYNLTRSDLGTRKGKAY